MSRRIAFAGIFTGLAAVLIYISTLLPTGKLTLYLLSSLPVAFTIIEFGSGAGILVYFAACILSALITGNIMGIVPFALFFGHYPVFKYFIEKGRGAAAEVCLKLAVFNLSLFLWYILFRGLFMEALPVQYFSNNILIIALAVVLQAAFFVYDYVFSRLICYYEAKADIFKRK
jgi:hypothetical protein